MLLLIIIIVAVALVCAPPVLRTLIIIIVAVALGIVFTNSLLGLVGIVVGFWGWVGILILGVFILAFLAFLRFYGSWKTSKAFEQNPVY